MTKANENQKAQRETSVWDILINPEASERARQKEAERIENFWFPSIKFVKKKPS